MIGYDRVDGGECGYGALKGDREVKGGFGVMWSGWWMKGSGLTRGENGAVSPTTHMGDVCEPLCHCIPG